MEKFRATGKFNDGRTFAADFYAESIMDAYKQATDAYKASFQKDDPFSNYPRQFAVNPVKERETGGFDMVGLFKVSKTPAKKRARKTTTAATTATTTDPAQTDALANSGQQDGQQDAGQQDEARTPATTGGRRRGGSSNR